MFTNENLFSKALDKCLYRTFRAGAVSIPADTLHKCNVHFVPIHWNLVSNRILLDSHRWTWLHFQSTHSMHSIVHLYWRMICGQAVDGASLDGSLLPDSNVDVVAFDVWDSYDSIECSRTTTSSTKVEEVVASCCFHRNFFYVMCVIVFDLSIFGCAVHNICIFGIRLYFFSVSITFMYESDIVKRCACECS